METGGELGEDVSFGRSVPHIGRNQNRLRRDTLLDGNLSEAIAFPGHASRAEHEDPRAPGLEESDGTLEAAGIRPPFHLGAGAIAWAEYAAAESEDRISLWVGRVGAPGVAVLEGAHKGIGNNRGAEDPKDDEGQGDECTAPPAKRRGEHQEGSA
jgi:hypothetical protein